MVCCPGTAATAEYGGWPAGRPTPGRLAQWSRSNCTQGQDPQRHWTSPARACVGTSRRAHPPTHAPAPPLPAPLTPPQTKRGLQQCRKVAAHRHGTPQQQHSVLRCLELQGHVCKNLLETLWRGTSAGQAPAEHPPELLEVLALRADQVPLAIAFQILLHRAYPQPPRPSEHGYLVHTQVHPGPPSVLRRHRHPDQHVQHLSPAATQLLHWPAGQGGHLLAEHTQHASSSQGLGHLRQMWAPRPAAPLQPTPAAARSGCSLEAIVGSSHA
mmetsp:Transcript_14836/g.43312  ORF Transcript_14836/g.43312 Transcript_14836/m.43312 type:complete len:270 (-) Transcript_14836:984-1793(-)